jgi:uncharacterized Zn finger protein (UPF0148 family)
MPQELPHNLQKTLLGGFTVKYSCPKCTLALENPLSEAGQVDTCPNCKTQFKVPGSKSKVELARKRQLEKEQAEQVSQAKKEQEIAKMQEAKLAREMALAQREMEQVTAPVQVPVAEQGAGAVAKESAIAFLNMVRGRTCYSILRMLIDVNSYLLGFGIVMSAAVGFIMGSTQQNGLLTLLSLISGGVGVITVIALNQAAMLLIDIADTLIEQNRNKN